MPDLPPQDVIHSLGTFEHDISQLYAVHEVLKSGWLSPGKNVQAFEHQIAHLHDNQYGVMVNSGTDALRIALLALKEKFGWADGDEVIVPAVTFVATVNTILQANLKPLFCDVSMYDFNINPYNVIRRFFEQGHGFEKIRAIVPVHIGGRVCDMDVLLKIAQDHHLKILEDSCEAIGVPGIGQGDITCFSFYMAHLVTTGVGGMAITRDQELARLMWSYANHGRREAKGFIFDRIGYSSRGTEFEAALGLAQLPKLPNQIERRRLVCQVLYDALKDLDDFNVMPPGSSACMFFPVMIQETSLLNKVRVMEHLAGHGIESRELLPLINQPCYKNLIDRPEGFAVAQAINERGFYIGCHQDLTQACLDKTISVFKDYFSRGS